MNKAPVSQEYLMVNMEQESWPVRSEDADFGADIGKVFPGLCVNTTGREMENHGTAWTEIRSQRGWYDWNKKQTYHQGWVPSSILKNEPSCGQARGLAHEIFKSIQPGLGAEFGKACGEESKAEAFVRYTMNQPAMVQWLDRRMPGGVSYEQIDDRDKPATRHLAPAGMIVELAGIPFTLYTTCGAAVEKQFFNAFEFRVRKGKTRDADQLEITLDTGEAETLTITLERNIFRFIGRVDRGWIITKITRRPFKGE